jgi:hypothetical protein
VALAETRRGAAVVFVGAFAVWWVQTLAIPLAAGRDFYTYVGAYVELFQRHPIDLGYVLGRTPIAPLVTGGLLDIAGGALAEPAIALLYAASITAWFVAARSFGGRAALLVAVGLLAYPGYGIVFHELSSDAVFAAAFAGWALLAVRVLLSPTPGRAALVGLGAGVLALVRPGSASLLVVAAIFLAIRASWRVRVASAVAFALGATAVIGAWTIHNGVRYGDYTLARGGNSIPFYRAFLTDRIVRPSNGPASRELARAVEQDLLPKEPYRSYGIDLDTFFSKGSTRMHEDLVALSNRLWGWNSDGHKLREVGIEAVRTHPGAYTRGVTTTIWQLLSQPLYRTLPPGGAQAAQPHAGGDGGGGDGGREGDTIVVNGRRLPRPTEGEPIPAAHEGGVATPDGSIYTVWTSPSEHHLVFVHPGAEARYRALHRRMGELGGALPHRDRNAMLARRLNQASRWYPPPALWLVLGVVLLAVRRPRGALALATPAVAALVVVVLSALGLPAEAHYAVPVAPAFVLLLGGALLGRRQSPRALTRAQDVTVRQSGQDLTRVVSE